MVWLLRTALALSLLGGLTCAAQEQAPSPEEPKYEFVSGVITEIPPGKIVVNRALLGKPPKHAHF